MTEACEIKDKTAVVVVASYRSVSRNAVRFKALGEKLTSTIPNFASLKTLRNCINKVEKSLSRLKFT